MPYSPPPRWRTEDDQPPVTWEEIRPRELCDNPEYAMYQAVLDVIAELLGTEEP